MATFAKEKKFEKILYSRITVILLLIVVLFLSFSVYSVFEKRQQAQSRATVAEQEAQALSLRKAKTQTEIQNLQTNEGIEQVLRDKYRAAKDGEGLVVIVDRTSKNTTNKDEDVNISIFERISRFFRN